MKQNMRIMGIMLVVLVALSCGAYGAENGPLLMVDQGHGQRFLIEKSGPLDLSSLASIFSQKGFRVVTNAAPLTDETLSTVEGLVISGAFAPFTATEIDALVRFLSRGGKLAVMLHIAPPMNNLLQRLGVAYSNGVIRERQNIIKDDPLNFQVTRLEPHAITKELKQFSLYGVWALINSGENVSIIASTSPEAWIDLDGNRKFSKGDAVQSFGVAVTGKQGNGSFVVFGDDALFQNQFLDEQNRKLAGNLADWFK